MESDFLAGLSFQLRVEVDGVPVKPLHVDAGVVEGDEAGGMPGRALREVGFLQEHDILVGLDSEMFEAGLKLVSWG